MDDGLIAELSNVLSIRGTGKKILKILARHKRGLLVSELLAHSGKSERAVRAHLKSLLQLHLVRRKKATTEKGKMAYRYFSLHTHELVESVRKEVFRRLSTLEKYQSKLE